MGRERLFPCGEELDAIFGAGDATRLVQFADGDRPRGIDPVLGDPGGEFGEVELLQGEGEIVVEPPPAVHNFVGRLPAVEVPPEGLDEWNGASFFLPAHALAGCFALS